MLNENGEFDEKKIDNFSEETFFRIAFSKLGKPQSGKGPVADETLDFGLDVVKKITRGFLQDLDVIEIIKSIDFSKLDSLSIPDISGIDVDQMRENIMKQHQYEQDATRLEIQNKQFINEQVKQ